MRGAIALIALAPLAGGCLGTTTEERTAIAAWEDCIDGAIAERTVPPARMPAKGRETYFEVTYQCRALFPNLDQPSRSSAGRQLLSRVYRRLAY
jgi:hypothetical protein